MTTATVLIRGSIILFSITSSILMGLAADQRYMELNGSKQQKLQRWLRLILFCMSVGIAFVYLSYRYPLRHRRS